MDLMPFDWRNFIYPVRGWDGGSSGLSIEQKNVGLTNVVVLEVGLFKDLRLVSD